MEYEKLGVQRSVRNAQVRELVAESGNFDVVPI